ncbi:MAG: orotate phosphoribosyltransferase [Omnitrophica bacterium]|nr:orotate phosphoribosyltransferase [Candidatus Omnitrophota bacterium]
MNEAEILDIFNKTGAILDGHFKLSSGLHSAQYLQCAKVLQYPEHAAKLCSALAARFKTAKPDVVIAPAVGGILVSYEVARALNVRSLFMERVDGKMTLRRGLTLKRGEKALVVEDVVTTGLSTREVIDALKPFGTTLVGAGCIVDRTKEKPNFPASFESLIKIDTPTFNPKECPLCKNGTPITKPGSRA